MDVCIDPKRPVLFVDGNYYVPYRFYKTLHQCSLAPDHPDFLDVLCSDVSHDVEMWTGCPRVFGTRNVLLCIGQGSKRALVPRPPKHTPAHESPHSAKATASTHAKQTNTKIPACVYDAVLACCCEWGVPSIREVHLAPCQIIGCLQQLLKEHGFTGRFTILANHGASYAHMLHPNTRVVDMYDNDLTPSALAGDFRTLSKVMQGDMAMGIPPIWRGISRSLVVFLAALPEKERLHRIQQRGASAVQTYMHNRSVLFREASPASMAKVQGWLRVWLASK